MIHTIRSIVHIKELRRRILFTAGVFFLIRVLSQVPVPGVNTSFLSAYFGDSGIFPLINAFTGGGFSNFSILALSVTPYITSSIIIQLMTIAIPKLEELQKDGATGRKRITQITRILTVVLAVIESVSLCVGFRSSMLMNFNALNVIAVAAVMTSGSAFLMWLGERINERGIGNGISMILLLNIVSRVPADLDSLFRQFILGHSVSLAVGNAILIAVIILAVLVFSIVLNFAQREIPVQYSAKMRGAASSAPKAKIPIRANVSGVVPVIFATSILAIPGMVVALAGIQASGVWGVVLHALTPAYWFNTSDWLPTLGVILYTVMLYFFGYFYAQVNYNPLIMADNIRKNGGVISTLR